MTSSTVPANASRATSSCSIAGRSRWLVGSSSTSRLTSLAISTASDARVRSPGDSVAGGAQHVVARPGRTWRAASGRRPGRAPVASWNARSRLTVAPRRRADRGPGRSRRPRRAGTALDGAGVGSTPAEQERRAASSCPSRWRRRWRRARRRRSAGRSARAGSPRRRVDDDAVEAGDDVTAAAGGARCRGAAPTALAACRRRRGGRSPARCAPPGRRAARSG